LAGEGSVREGAEPPLKFFPPLKQTEVLILNINQFERGIKGVSMKEKSIENLYREKDCLDTVILKTSFS
jgi:hypothetical protein